MTKATTPTTRIPPTVSIVRRERRRRGFLGGGPPTTAERPNGSLSLSSLERASASLTGAAGISASEGCGNRGSNDAFCGGPFRPCPLCFTTMSVDTSSALIGTLSGMQELQPPLPPLSDISIAPKRVRPAPGQDRPRRTRSREGDNRVRNSRAAQHSSVILSMCPEMTLPGLPRIAQSCLILTFACLRSYAHESKYVGGDPHSISAVECFSG